MKTLRVVLMVLVVAFSCVTIGCYEDDPGPSCGDRDGNGTPYPCPTK